MEAIAVSADEVDGTVYIRRCVSASPQRHDSPLRVVDMRQTLYSQPIARPPVTVWAYLADLRNDVAWRAEIKKAELVVGTPRADAAQYRETVVDRKSVV